MQICRSVCRSCAVGERGGNCDLREVRKAGVVQRGWPGASHARQEKSGARLCDRRWVWTCTLTKGCPSLVGWGTFLFGLRTNGFSQSTNNSAMLSRGACFKTSPQSALPRLFSLTQWADHTRRRNNLLFGGRRSDRHARNEFRLGEDSNALRLLRKALRRAHPR